MKNLLPLFCFALLFATNLTAQNVGIGTSSPGTKLHVAGAIASTPNTDVAAASVTIPDNTSIFRLSAAVGTQANALSMAIPTEGQLLTIYNEDGDVATFAGQTIAATSGVASFQYINSAWRYVSSNQSGGGGSGINNSLSQQTSANYNIDGNGLLSGAGSQGTIGTGTPNASNGKYELTLTPNATISSGINISLSSPSTTAYGVNISASSVSVNGILVSNSTSSTSSSVYGMAGILSSTNIVSGYNAYRNGSGLSYGLYGINGTNGSYATNASTWAAFLQGRTVVSSESSPTSPVGTDLEVRNTTTGAGAPATIALRQTTSLGTIGNVLGDLNFGDNYVTTPQAQIQVQRDAAASSTSDMPTAMTFWTTPDASATLTERMRISNNGNVGIGMTAATTNTLDVTGGLTKTANFTNSLGTGIAVFGNSSAAASTSTGIGVVGSSSQTQGFGTWGQNLNASGTGILGVGNAQGPQYITTGSGGAFTGLALGVFAYATTTGAGQAIYTNLGGFITRVNYYNGTTQYKINGTGSVSTIVKDVSGSEVTLHCPETPEIYFQDFGEGELVNGRAHISIDPTFSKNITVNSMHPLRAFIQLNGDCKGVYTVNETQTGFDVIELQGGQSNVKFHWTVTANRADEDMGNGKISHNADMRFEKAGPHEPMGSLKQK